MAAMNIPNLLTLVRIILTPLMVIFLIQSRYLEAFGTFTIAGFTDAVDGLIARWLKQKTRIGAILDPVADKLLLSSSYVVMAILGLLPAWLAVIVISRDVIIVLGVLILFLFQGGVEIRPSILGKITTFLQLGTVFMVFVSLHWLQAERILAAFCSLTAFVTVVSGTQYMIRGARLFNSI